MSNTPTHLNEAGDAHVVSISAKAVTARFAIAECFVRMAPETLRSITEGVAKKGDVIAVARIAGIQATKRTAELIPLCHPIAVTGCELDITPEAQGVRIQARVDAVDRTGAEMEAMTAASVAGLTIYDMVKGTERGVTIEAVRLLEKAGGKSGHWKR